MVLQSTLRYTLYKYFYKKLIFNNSPKPLFKKRPTLTLQVNFLGLTKVVSAEQDKSVSMSAQKSAASDTFQFKEIFSAELKNIYDNYHIFKIFYDASMRKCSRLYMEDRICAISHTKSQQMKESFFGVFDGHKTQEISNMLKNKLYTAIQSQKSYETHPIESIISGALSLDQEIQDHIKARNLKGGSTAICALIRNKTIHLFNVGDSIAVLYSNDGIKQINEQHRPSNPKEHEILVNKGAVLLERGGIIRINGELGITRSFGDNDHKEYISATPEIHSFQISPNDKYLILASDGYWDIMNLEETDELIKMWEYEKSQTENYGNIENLSSYLINEAQTKMTNFKKDNMTLLAIDLSYIYQDNPMVFSKVNLD